MCEKCSTINKMDNKDLKTAYCIKCGTKNDWIEYMIKIANDTETSKQAEYEMDFYKKNKDGALDR